jgi:F-type H+-transporting ATPase subunit b
VRNRMRALIAALGIVVALGVVAGPAVAQETGGSTEVKYATKADEECAKLLAEGGTVDDCHEAPSPLIPEKNEIIWGSLAFLVLLVAMWKWGVPAVKNMEEAREARIRTDLEAAEKTRLDVQAEKATYDAQLADARNEAGRIIDEARQAAETVRRDLIARAEEEANDVRARAQADIANQRTQAMSQLRTDVAALSIDLAGRIVERNLDDDTNRQLVDSFIDQVGSN